MRSETRNISTTPEISATTFKLADASKHDDDNDEQFSSFKLESESSSPD